MHQAAPGDATEQKEGPRRSRPHIMSAVDGLRFLRLRPFGANRGVERPAALLALCRPGRCCSVFHALELWKPAVASRPGASAPTSADSRGDTRPRAPSHFGVGVLLLHYFIRRDAPTEQRPHPPTRREGLEKSALAALPTGPLAPGGPGAAAHSRSGIGLSTAIKSPGKFWAPALRPGARARSGLRSERDTLRRAAGGRGGLRPSGTPPPHCERKSQRSACRLCFLCKGKKKHVPAQVKGKQSRL